MFRSLVCSGLFVWLLLPTFSFAYGVTPHDVKVPYDIVSVPGTVDEQQFIVGTLKDYPQMVEVKSDKEFTLRAELRALPGATTTPDLAGIIVQVLDRRGVAEVARLNAGDATWKQSRERVSGLAYLAGPVYDGRVPAGTYHIEVSAPENIGKYILVLGTVPTNSSYGDTWAAVSRLYSFYGASKIGMIRSPLVYYPLGIVLLLGGFGYTIYRTRGRVPFFKHA
jgi:hypothetical protein